MLYKAQTKVIYEPVDLWIYPFEYFRNFVAGVGVFERWVSESKERKSTKPQAPTDPHVSYSRMYTSPLNGLTCRLTD